MIEKLLDFSLDFGLYVLWQFTLALTLASSIILFNYWRKSKGTPLGNTAFYFFLNSFWWSVASTIITIPIITKMGFVESYFFLFFPFLAGLASILGTYHRARIQSFLQPGTTKQRLDSSLWFIISFCIFCVSLIAVIGAILNNPILNFMITGIGGLTGLGFMLISGLFFALPFNRAQKLIFIGSATLLILGLIAIIGFGSKIFLSSSLLLGAPIRVTTALVFVIVGFWTAIAKLSGLKWWILKMVMSLAVLSSIIIGFATHLGFHSQQDLTSLLTLLIFLVGGALLMRSWKMQRL